MTSQPVLTTRAETKDVVTADLLESTVQAFQPPWLWKRPLPPWQRPAEHSRVRWRGRREQRDCRTDTRADERARSTARTAVAADRQFDAVRLLLGVLAMCAGIGLVWLFSRPLTSTRLNGYSPEECGACRTPRL